MNEKEFNLLDEHWIRVIDDQCRVSELSLKDAILNAHNYKALSGELPTQDVAIMRLILSVLHTVFSRVDENGEDAPLDEDDEDEALERWKALWDKGQFSEKAINEYLDKWKERFWLFHPERPFYQIPQKDMLRLITKQRKLALSKFNGEISKSENKANLFTQYSGDDMNSMSYSQAARWLVFTNSFDDTAFKPQGKNDHSASVGWNGQIGLIYIVGDSLFETLMLNLVMINNDHIEYKQSPIWESEIIRCNERIPVPFPDNLAELYTLQSRRIHLFRENDIITHFHILAGDLISAENGFEEPMTAWSISKSNNTTSYFPKKHDSPQQMWKEFSVLYDIKGKDCAGIIKWYKNYLIPNRLISRNRILKTAITAIEYDKSSAHKFLNYLSDSLTMHSSLLSELGVSWRNIIELEISNCNSLANSAATLAKNLYVASGGSNSKKDKHYAEIPSIAKSQLYFRLDLPFREWLRTIDPENTNEKKKYEKQKEWQETAKRIAYSYAKELVSQSAETALVGHKADGRIYSAPKAMNIFKSELNKIYPKE